MSPRILAVLGLVLVLAAPVRGQRHEDLPADAERDIAEGVAWLVAHRNGDGGWGCGEPPTPSSSGITGLAVMALVAGGSTPTRGPHGEAIDRGIEYLCRIANERTGAIVGEYVTEFGEAYDHACATLGLATAQGMLRDHDGERMAKVSRILERAVVHLHRTQNPDGGWTRYGGETSDPMVTAKSWLALRAVQSVGIPVAIDREKVERYSRRAAVAYGGMAAGNQEINDVAGWLRIMFGLGLEDQADVDRIAREVARNYLTRHTPQPVSEWDYVAVMLLAQAYHHERGEYWRTWFPAMRRYLQSIQNADGSWEIINCVQCKALATSLALIALQTPRRLLPMQEK